MPRGKRSRSAGREGSPAVKYSRVGSQEWVTPEEASKQLKFEEVLGALRATVGLPPASYSSRGEYVFHLYSLFEVVGMYGGFAYACSKSLWGHIAGALCKVSKRQVSAAREAESCYKELLYPFEDRLRALGTMLEHAPELKMESGPESMINLISQSSESPSGGSVRDGVSWGKPLAAKAYSPVQSQNEYSLNPMHVIHVKLPGLPYIPRVPILTSTPSSSPPHRSTPVCSPLDSSQKSPWSEWDANTGDTPSGSASNPNASTSIQLPSLLDGETLHGLGIDLTGRQGTRRGRGRGSRGRGRGRPRGGRGGRHYRRSTRGRGRASARTGNSQKYRSIFPFTLQVSDVPDPIPGNTFASMVHWLKALATEVKECVDGSNVDHHAALHLRYSGDILTIRDVMSKSARKACKEEARARRSTLPPVASYTNVGLIQGKPRRKAAYGRDFTAEAGEASSCISDEDESEESQEAKEGEEYQADIPPWRPKPAVPCEDEFRWFSGKIWPLPEEAFQFRRNNELGPLQETLIPAVPRPEGFLSDIDARHNWVDSSSRILEKLLGPAAKDLGLPFMGYRVRRSWATEDEVSFEKGIRSVGRDFTKLRNIFLPHKSVSEIVLYYYNIWKVKRTHSARIWYDEVQEEKLEHLRAKEREEVYEDVEDNKIRDHKIKLAQRRAIKATLYWMRTVATNPLGVKLLQRGKTWDRAVRLQYITRRPTNSTSIIQEHLFY